MFLAAEGGKSDLENNLLQACMDSMEQGNESILQPQTGAWTPLNMTQQLSI